MAKKVKLATILRAGRSVTVGSGTAGTPPPVGNQPPRQTQTIPNFSLQRGTSRLLTPYFEDPEGDPIYYRKAATPANTSKITISPDGVISADSDCPLGTYQVKIEFSDQQFQVDPPAGTGKTWIADIPEQWFLTGYPETEEMGIYICDPLNRVNPGDLWWQTGARLQRHAEHGGGNWAPRETVTLSVVTGTMPPGVSFDASTGRLIYDGTNITGAHSTCTARLTSGSRSQDFRIRVLRPTVICTSAPASLPAAVAGVPTFTPSSSIWSTLRTTGGSGQSDSTPRVILFDNEQIPRNDWNIGNANSNPDFTFMYICGVPGGTTQLGLPYSQAALGVESFSLARFQAWHWKNLRMGNVALTTLAQESGFPTRWSIQKMDWLDRNANSNISNVQNGADWLPNSYPTKVNDFRFYAANVQMHQVGYMGGTQHGFYIETNGYTWAIFNNLRINGGNRCSLVQSVVGHHAVRNSYLAFCATPDAPYTQTYWAAEMIDPHSLCESIVYNNLVISGRDSGDTDRGGTQNACLAFLSNRRPAKGSNTPNYPSLSWSPPMPATGGPESPRLGTFPPGGATYADPAFWNAVSTPGLENGDNAYLFRHFYSYNIVRHHSTPTKGKIMRLDGTHPCEVRVQLGTDTHMLGAPPGWVERCTVFLMNNTYENWTAAQCDTTTQNAFERYDSQNVTMVEDGTKMVSRNITCSDGSPGTIRVKVATGTVHDATANVRDLMGWDAVTPPSYYDTFAELQNGSGTHPPILLTPDSWSDNPVKWPPAKWPAGALGSGHHPELALVEPWGVTRIVNQGGHRTSDAMSVARVDPPSWFRL